MVQELMTHMLELKTDAQPVPDDELLPDAINRLEARILGPTPARS